jgi:Tol biopolymer transport system component
MVRRFEGFYREPQYSPDGKSLAYISTRASMSIGVSGGRGDSLIVRSLATGDEREYQRGMAELGVMWFSYPRWSPDSRSILLYGRDQRDRYGVYRIDVESGKAACVLRQPEGTPIGLAGWRDENSFLYGRLDKKNNRGEICVGNLGNGDETVLAIRPAVRADVAVSPDRRWVSAIERYQSGEQTLLTISTTSGEIGRLIKFSQEEGDILLRHTWSADSRYVFYARRVGSVGLDYKFELWRVPVDGGEPQRMGLETPGAIVSISSHPDREHVAFECRASVSASPAEVWVMENFLPK